MIAVPCHNHAHPTALTSQIATADTTEHAIATQNAIASRAIVHEAHEPRAAAPPASALSISVPKIGP